MNVFYSVEEVAPLLRVTPQTLRNWIREGKVHAERMGRPYLIPVEEAARLLKRTPDEVHTLIYQAKTAKSAEDHEPGIWVPSLLASV
ncbi:MAG: helix-turn-helix domain-containing protein [Blastochloris sp.]|nr:helix-turn-helix domain-containing protein [Blastochloris sp.]